TAVPGGRAVERAIALASDVVTLDPDQADRHPAEVCVPHDRRLRAGPGAPALQVAAVPIDERLHDGSHGEWPFATRVGGVVEDLAHGREPVAMFRRVGTLRDVAPERVARPVPAGSRLAREHVGVAVMLVERAQGGGGAPGIVL